MSAPTTRRHRRSASMGGVPVKSTALMMDSANAAVNGERTGSASPPAWKPKLKTRPQSFQVLPGQSALPPLPERSSLRHGSSSSGAGNDFAGPTVQRMSAMSIGNPKSHSTHPPRPARPPASSSPIFGSNNSHMPHSIFPSEGSSRTRHPNSQTSSSSSMSSSSPPSSFRQTIVLQPRKPVPFAPVPNLGTRRDRGPPRSSPLAGPAVGQDGTLIDDQQDKEGKAKYKPNRISSTPDVTVALSLDKEKRRVSVSAPASPTLRVASLPPSASASHLHLPESSAASSEDLSATSSSSSSSGSSSSSSPTKQSKRLSLRFKRLSLFTPLSGHQRSASEETKAPLSPKTSVSAPNTPSLPDATPPASRSRTHSTSNGVSPTNVQPNEAVPPVPAIPAWALQTFGPPPQGSDSNTIDLSQTLELPSVLKSAKPIGRRPATAPSLLDVGPGTFRSQSLSSRKSRQSLTPSTFTTPQHPNTSSDPESNWLSAASAPRFSRLGIKGAGVILPVSVKEVEKARKRHSTIGALSVLPDSDNKSVRNKGSAQSLASVSSARKEKSDKGKEKEKPLSEETLLRMREAAEAVVPVVPPNPPFFRGESTTSLATSGGTRSTSTSVCSVGSIGTVISVASTSTSASVRSALVTPATSVNDLSVGVVPEGPKKGVELRVNDVTVEIIDVKQEKERRKQSSERSTANVKKSAAESKPLEKRGTLRRMWKKVVGHS